MKNINTPRTLAECEFTVGHQQVAKRSSTHAAEWVTLAIAALSVAAFGFGWLP